MKAEEVVAGILLALLLIYVVAINPDIFRISRVGYSIEFKFEEKTYFIWTNRWVDVVIQAFMLFATATALSALFREEKVEEAEEEVVVEGGEG